MTVLVSPTASRSPDALLEGRRGRLPSGHRPPQTNRRYGHCRWAAGRCRLTAITESRASTPAPRWWRGCWPLPTLGHVQPRRVHRNEPRHHPGSLWPWLGRRRRPTTRSSPSIPVGHASMWPRLGRRGRHAVVPLPAVAGARFNVATALGPWKTKGDHSPIRAADVASMWPRLGRRGRRFRAGSRPSPNARLQCGHGLDAVEDQTRPVPVTKPSVLQCGHGLDAVEDTTSIRHGPRWSGFIGFNGATAGSPWKTPP